MIKIVLTGNVLDDDILELLEKEMRERPEFRKRVDAISAKLFGEMMEEEYDRGEKYEEE